MPVITLPDGSQRSFENPVSTYDVAADIGLVWQKPVSLVVLTVNVLMLAI